MPSLAHRDRQPPRGALVVLILGLALAAACDRSPAAPPANTAAPASDRIGNRVGVEDEAPDARHVVWSKPDDVVQLRATLAQALAGSSAVASAPAATPDAAAKERLRALGYSP
ncbi:MAG TPA: hypothetical protein VL049_24380 [Candidatus Dormibacteraeota bacterium]|nr:hypothetical protein [Candidatus Dormibacteraeota bacterium]